MCCRGSQPQPLHFRRSRSSKPPHGRLHNYLIIMARPTGFEPGTKGCEYPAIIVISQESRRTLNAYSVPLPVDPIPSARPSFRGPVRGKADQAHRVAGPNRPNRGQTVRGQLCAGGCDFTLKPDYTSMPIAGCVRWLNKPILKDRNGAQTRHPHLFQACSFCTVDGHSRPRVRTATSDPPETSGLVCTCT